jgi:hypothetical protein
VNQVWLVFVIPVLLSLAVNEVCDVAPWLAQKLVRRAARLWAFDDAAQALELGEEWAAIVNDAPGKLTKLGHALRFAGGAVWRFQSQRVIRSAVIQRVLRSRSVVAGSTDVEPAIVSFDAAVAAAGGRIRFLIDDLPIQDQQLYFPDMGEAVGPAAVLLVDEQGRFGGVAFPDGDGGFLAADGHRYIGAHVELNTPGDPLMVQLEQFVRERRQRRGSSK